MSTDGEKRRCFSRLANAQGSCPLGPKYRLSNRVYSARTGQPLTAAYLFAPNSYRIAKLVRNAGLTTRLSSVVITRDRRATLPNQEVEIHPLVRLQDVIDVDLDIAPLGVALRWFPGRLANIELSVVHMQMQGTRCHIERDQVSVPHERK